MNKFPLKFLLLTILFNAFLGLISLSTMSSVAKAKSKEKSILIVATNTYKMGQTDIKTGLWAEELVLPYNLFKAHGFKLVIASPKGGMVPLDQASINERVVGTKTFKIIDTWLTKNGKLLDHTVTIDAVSVDDFDAILVAGGHGAMWDIAANKTLAQLVGDFLYQGKAVGTIGHGAALFVGAEEMDGSFLLAGYHITGFSNREETALHTDKVLPLSLEDGLQVASGGLYSAKDKLFAPHIITDRNLISGQNTASSMSVARAMVKNINKGFKKNVLGY